MKRLFLYPAWLLLFLPLALSESKEAISSPRATPDETGMNVTLLPATFNGWQKVPQSDRSSRQASAADPADSAVLEEYGFSDMEQAGYLRDDRKMLVKAARFRDA